MIQGRANFLFCLCITQYNGQQSNINSTDISCLMLVPPSSCTCVSEYYNSIPKSLEIRKQAYKNTWTI